VEIYAKRLIKTREKLNLILSERTGQPLETIAKDTDRDNFMDPDEAKAYGLIDEIIVSR
jgi:ATP-dependent Clp protease protease subunit